MKKFFTILTTICLSIFLQFSQAGAENQMTINGRTLPLGPTSAAGSGSMTGDARNQGAFTPGLTASSTVFRDVPSISGHYSIGGKTFLPYLGAGFGSGYTSQLDRSLNTPLSPGADAGLRSQFGQNMTPNEFQMGIRIPF